MDPNRVTEVTLEAFQINFKNKNYFEILKRLNRLTVGPTLGHKFSLYQGPTDITPKELFYVTAYLIKHRYIEVAEIWPHLSPSDDSLEKNFESKMEIAKRHFKGVFISKLNQDADQRKKDKDQENIEIESLSKQITSKYKNI